MPTTEYTITGKHDTLGCVSYVAYSLELASDIAVIWQFLGYAVEISERSLVEARERSLV